MSEIINNEKQDNTVHSPSAAAEVTGPAIVPPEQVSVDAEAAGDAADVLNAAGPIEVESSPKADSKKTPVKRTPSKRMSFIERAQKESEELVKNMGGSLELEGGRRTRSSTRGTPTRSTVASTPPPNKKARNSPAAASANTASRARGRGRKIDTSGNLAEEVAKKPEPQESAAEEQTFDVDSAKAAENRDVQPALASSHKAIVEENNEEKAVESDGATAKTVALEQTKPGGTASSEGQIIAADDIDAPLESMPKEKQNDREHESTKIIQKGEVGKSVSPMDVDEQQIEPESEPELESDSDAVTLIDPEPTRFIAAVNVEQSKTTTSVLAEAAVKATVAAEVSHEPADLADTSKEVLPTASVTSPTVATPEPMEVDSNSKSNDFADTPTAAAEVVAAPFAGVNEHNNTEPIEETVSAPAIAKQPPPVAEALDSTVVTVTAATNAVVNNSVVDENAVVRTATEENASSTETKLAIEMSSMASAVENTTKNATVENESKHQNDFCEPKIVASPPMNAAPEGSTTTPQYCN